ncbi:PQQ-binding-like beta-propeller repeat protein [Streptomyces sp. NPDC127190]|uniref:protein kinase domain-containing protein n=1 Tax=unclassified Streptomyces TaxID=2593676 RepID=UPI00362A63F4
MTPQRSTGMGPEAELPEYVGHYRLESCLGSGGMGVVHLARSTSGLKLAVKVVHAEFARDPEFRGRFRQEVAAARRVSGAFTAPVVDADPEAERPWMATLFIPGPTLSEQVKRNGPMNPAQVRRLMAGLAEALRDIHRVGVVHRDLKPSNVLLAEDGPKVIDFGISRPKDSELRTETGKLIGTPPFMAPEQFRRPREVGPAADIFALGSVLVHAATGRGPFDSDSPYLVAYQVVHDEPDLTGVPESLAPLVLRCLAKEPEERPTPDELMRELRSVAASYDTQAFIPAQRAGAGEVPSAPVPHTGAGADRGAGRWRMSRVVSRLGSRLGSRPGSRWRSRRVLVAAVSVVLVLGGVLAAVLWPEGAAGPAVTKGARSAGAGFAGWRVRPVGGGAGMPQCTYGVGRVLCVRSGTAFALDALDGRLLWRRTVGGAPAGGVPALADGVLLLPANGGRRVVALDAASGRPRWHRELPGAPSVQVAGGMLVIAGADGTMTGVSGTSGETGWRRRVTTGATGGTPSLARYDGDPLVYATTTALDGTATQITAFDPAGGTTRWQARLRGTLRPLGSRDGSLFLMSVDNASATTDEVLRYTPATGTARRVALPVALTTPAAATHGDVAYLLGTGGSLDAVSPGGEGGDGSGGVGRRLWHLETAVSRGSAPVATGAYVYFSAPDGRLLAVDARDGRLAGQTPLRLGAGSGQVAGALSAPLVVGGRVYASAPDGSVFAVDGGDPRAW